MTTITFSVSVIEEANLSAVSAEHLEEAAEALSEGLGDYMNHLGEKVEGGGFTFDWTPEQQAWAEYVSADTAEEEDQAYFFLESLPGFWEWYC